MKSRIIAEQQFNQITSELSKHNVRAEYEDLLIKKGEIYKEHIGHARQLKEQEVLRECTFRP
jgi:hypothetical protein